MVVWIKNLSDLPKKSIIAIRNFSEVVSILGKKLSSYIQTKT